MTSVTVAISDDLRLWDSTTIPPRAKEMGTYRPPIQRPKHKLTAATIAISERLFTAR
jgi:hypothetical protein